MSAEPTGEPSMRQSMAALWRGRWVALACAALAGAAGVAFAERRGLVRRAKATLHVERAESVVADGDFARFRDGRGFASAQAALLKSSPTIQRALEALGDGPLPLFDDVADRLAFVRRELAVTAGAEDGMLTVAFDAADCATASALVNAVVDSYATRLVEAQQATAATALDALRDDLTRRQAEAAVAESEHRRAIEADPSLALDDDARRAAVSARLAELGSAIAQAEAVVAAEASDAAAARACAEAEDPLAATPFPGMDEPTQRHIAERARRVDELAQRRERLRSVVTDEHPEAARCEAALVREREDARAAAREAARSAATAASSRAEAAKARAASLAARMRNVEQAIVESAPAVARARALAAEAERARRAAAALTDRIHDVGLAAAAASSQSWPRSALVYERADPASSPVVQGKGATVAAATFAGLAFGVAFVWFRSLARPSVHEARELEGLAAAVEFPGVARRAGVEAEDRRLLGPAHLLVARLREIAGAARGGAVCVAGASDDRATVAIGAALAAAFAEQGERTLLCDPFGLGGGARKADAVRPSTEPVDPVRPTATAGLWLLDGAESLRRDSQSWDGAATRALARLAERFDRVVVLAPATLRAIDAQMLARACGAVALVGRAGELRFEDARDAVEALAVIGVPRAAFALHGVSSRRARIAAPRRDGAQPLERARPGAKAARVAKVESERGRGDGAIGESA